MRIQFKTKARTLSFLQSQNLIFNVPQGFFFTKKEWTEEKDKICEYIKKNFSSLIVVRSSALNEDTLKKSSAGTYNSYLNIKNEKKNIIKNVNNVFESYKNKKNYDLNNEVLVQNMIKDVNASGVIFTKNISNGAPYYIINYDDLSGKTDTVTSGVDKYSNRVLKVLKNKEFYLKSKRFKKLVKATKQLEEILNNKNLDIEFVINKKFEIFLLQVRPLIKVPQISDKLIFFKEVEKLNKEIDEKIGTKTNRTIFGQMPDWNPAEMIGKNPKSLSYSLYSTLITDKCLNDARVKWAIQK